MNELSELMSLFYDIKENITDNQYKTGVELLHKLYKKQGKVVTRPPPVVRRQILRYEVPLTERNIIKLRQSISMENTSLIVTNDTTANSNVGLLVREAILNTLTKHQLVDLLNKLGIYRYIDETTNVPLGQVNKQKLKDVCNRNVVFNTTQRQQGLRYLFRSLI